MLEKPFTWMAVWLDKKRVRGKKKHPIILLLKGTERVTKALPGVSRYKIAQLLSKAIIQSLWVWHRGAVVRRWWKTKLTCCHSTRCFFYVFFFKFVSTWHPDIPPPPSYFRSKKSLCCCTFPFNKVTAGIISKPDPSSNRSSGPLNFQFSSVRTTFAITDSLSPPSSTHF